MFTTRTLRPTITGLALAALLFLLTSASPTQAQPSFNATFGGAVDSFKPAAEAVESRQNLAGTFNLEHVFADGRGRLGYDLDAGNYDSPGEWSFLRHTARFTYRFGSDDTSARKFFLNGSFVTRANGEAWSAADYTGVGGGINAEFHPSERGTLRAGYRTDYRRFSDFAPLTQFEHRGFGSALVNLESRTTLIGEVQVGGKLYDGTVITDVPGVVIPAPSPAGGSQGMGGGYGGGSGMGYGGLNGAGQGLDLGMRWTGTPAHVSSSQEGSAGLVTIMGRVAQSLAERTGVHAQATVRRTFGAVPAALITTPAGFFEDGIYDDPYASDGVFLQAGVTQAFAGGAEVGATAWWGDKDYANTLALDASGVPMAGSPLRADTVTTATVTWSQPLFAARSGAVAFTADLGYRYIRHRSNDAYYNYTSHAAIVGFSIGY